MGYCKLRQAACLAHMDRDWAALERLDTRELHTPKFSMKPQEFCMEDDFGFGGYGHVLGSFPSETGSTIPNDLPGLMGGIETINLSRWF